MKQKEINQVVDSPERMGPFVEEWKPIKDFEGLYEVSNYGRIKSLAKMVRPNRGGYLHKERVMTSNCKKHRYKRITLKHNGNKTCRYVHRLVAIAFIPNPDNKETINHKNGFRKDNFVNNLEWATQAENNQHSYDIGLRESPMKGVKGKDHFASKPVYQLDATTGEIIRRFDSLSDAGRFLNPKKPYVASSSISSVISGKFKTSRGYKWRFADE